VQKQRLRLLMEDPSTAPNSQGVLVIDETGDRKDGHKTAHVGRQYLANLGKIDNGVVSVTSLWADERVYYPVDCEPYPPAHHFEKGKDDPHFRTKLKLAVELVRRAVEVQIPFRAVVADSFYGEDHGVKEGLRALAVGYVVALKPSHTWWHPIRAIGSLQEAARAAKWKGPERPGKWVKVTRTFRDGSSQDWWALEVVAGPYGPDKPERAVVATTDPVTLPDLTTFYLVTNLPLPGTQRAQASRLAAAHLAEVVRLYGLRMWVEQSYKQVKHALGWSQYQERLDQAIRRHWQLVCCAFSFCCYHASHPSASTTEEAKAPSEPEAPLQTSVPADAAGTGEKNQRGEKHSATGLLASGAARGQRLAGAVDHAERAIGAAGHRCPHLLPYNCCFIGLSSGMLSLSTALLDPRQQSTATVVCRSFEPDRITFFAFCLRRWKLNLSAHCCSDTLLTQGTCGKRKPGEKMDRCEHILKR